MSGAKTEAQKNTTHKTNTSSADLIRHGSMRGRRSTRHYTRRPRTTIWQGEISSTAVQHVARYRSRCKRSRHRPDTPCIEGFIHRSTQDESGEQLRRVPLLGLQRRQRGDRPLVFCCCVLCFCVFVLFSFFGCFWWCGGLCCVVCCL